MGIVKRMLVVFGNGLWRVMNRNMKFFTASTAFSTTSKKHFLQPQNFSPKTANSAFPLSPIKISSTRLQFAQKCENISAPRFPDRDKVLMITGFGNPTVRCTCFPIFAVQRSVLNGAENNHGDRRNPLRCFPIKIKQLCCQ